MRPDPSPGESEKKKQQTLVGALTVVNCESGWRLHAEYVCLVYSYINDCEEKGLATSVCINIHVLCIL